MSDTVTVRPVSSRSDFRKFIDLPYQLYKDTPYWVPPLRMDQKHLLNPKKNPFFEHGKIQPFLAEDAAGTVVGRIAAIVNGMHLEKYDDGNGFFGFFETIEDPVVAKALFDAASSWLKEEGLTGMRGPANPSLNDVAGLLVGGFDRYPSIMMPYNASYYESYLLDYGFSRAMTMWAYYLNQKYADIERVKRGSDIVLRRNPTLKFRKIDMSRYYEEAQTVVDIYNAAWAENWGNVAMTDAEFRHLADEMKTVVDPRIIYFVEDAGKPIAFSISLPNVNEILIHVKDGRLLPFGLLKFLLHSKIAGIRESRTMLMGVLPEYRGRGIDVLLHADLVIHAREYGYQASEMSWVLESNQAMVNTAESLGGVKDKEYAMFEMALE